MGDHSDKLWTTLTEILRKIVTADKVCPTEAKMKAFASGYGTILFFEDQEGVKKIQDQLRLYSSAFPGCFEHTSGMVQLIVWSALQAEGLRSSLQHYSPLIDEAVQKEWGVPTSWQWKAQIPFGNVVQGAGEKTFMPLEERVKFFHTAKPRL